METMRMDDCNWLSACCGAPPHYWVADICAECMTEAAWECVKCQQDTHREVPVGSLDCDPLSLHIMKAVGDMLKFYRGGK